MEAGERRFLLDFPVGTGKTGIVAAIGRTLLRHKRVDHVIYVAPQSELLPAAKTLLRKLCAEYYEAVSFYPARDFAHGAFRDGLQSTSVLVYIDEIHQFIPRTHVSQQSRRRDGWLGEHRPRDGHYKEENYKIIEDFLNKCTGYVIVGSATPFTDMKYDIPTYVHILFKHRLIWKPDAPREELEAWVQSAMVRAERSAIARRYPAIVYFAKSTSADLTQSTQVKISLADIYNIPTIPVCIMPPDVDMESVLTAHILARKDHGKHFMLSFRLETQELITRICDRLNIKVYTVTSGGKDMQYVHKYNKLKPSEPCVLNVTYFFALGHTLLGTRSVTITEICHSYTYTSTLQAVGRAVRHGSHTIHDGHMEIVDVFLLVWPESENGANHTIATIGARKILAAQEKLNAVAAFLQKFEAAYPHCIVSGNDLRMLKTPVAIDTCMDAILMGENASDGPPPPLPITDYTTMAIYGSHLATAARRPATTMYHNANNNTIPQMILNTWDIRPWFQPDDFVSIQNATLVRVGGSISDLSQHSKCLATVSDECSRIKHKMSTFIARYKEPLETYFNRKNCRLLLFSKHKTSFKRHYVNVGVYKRLKGDTTARRKPFKTHQKWKPLKDEPHVSAFTGAHISYQTIQTIQDLSAHLAKQLHVFNFTGDGSVTYGLQQLRERANNTSPQQLRQDFCALIAQTPFNLDAL